MTADQNDAGGKAEKMKESPVLFNGAMVRAILDDRKTQTRRPLKLQPVHVVPFIGRDNKPTYEFGLCMKYERAVTEHVRSPLGKPGDRLWVRETTKRFTGVPVGGKPWPTEAPWVLSPDGDPYKALLHVVGNEEHVKALEYHAACVTCVSIHMPRWAARLFLDVLDVRIERLQDISEEDARAEGVEQCGGFMTTWGCWMNYGKSGPSCKTARESFQTLWISVYGEESWAANPWVWVTEFKRVTQTL